MHFQIFIPGTNGQNPNMLADVGLPDLIAGAEFLPCASGPDGMGGTLIAWRKKGANQRFHYKETEQTWVPSAKFGESEPGRYWVGFWNDSPVTPSDLQRPYSHQGKTITLGDGNAWRMPQIQSLPHDMILADDGTWKFQLQRDYHDLWIESTEWIENLIQKQTHDFSRLVEFCVKCLRQNYRLVPEAVSHLKLFNTQNLPLAVVSILNLELADGE